MYIHSYTAVFHSQLPFFFVYLFLLFDFFYLSFFYFDFPLYNKHRRNRTSRKFMPNAHFHFTFHIHLTFTNTNTSPSNKLSSERFRNVFLSFHSQLVVPLYDLLWFCLRWARSDRHPHAAEFHERLTLAATAMWILLSCRWLCCTVEPIIVVAEFKFANIFCCRRRTVCN